MPGTIVCGVDVSHAAAPAIGVARRLAEGLGARLVIVHAVEGSDDRAEELAVLREGAGADEADVRLVPGPAPAALIAAADEEGARLLVVGSRGQSALVAGLLGSVTRDLATRSPVPLVVVPPGYAEGPAGDASIVVGVDGSQHAVAAARIAGALASGLGGRLVVVHVLKDARATLRYLGARGTAPPLTGQPDAREAEAVRIVEEAVGAAGGDAEGFVEPGVPWEALEAVADREGGRLLAVAARGQSATRAALFGSVATRLTADSTRPILVVPEPAEAAGP